MEIKRIVYQAPNLNFHVGPRLTFGTLSRRDPVIGNLPNPRLLQIVMGVNELHCAKPCADASLTEP